MRDYNGVPDPWLLNPDVTATEIIYIALAHGAYTSYENKIREKIEKKNSKH